MKLRTPCRRGGIALVLAATVVASFPARAADPPALECTLRFDLSGWSAVYQRSDGTGTVSCSDGKSLPVEIHVRGAGLTVGKSKIQNGSGKFTRVHQIDDVVGTYAAGDVHAGVVKSGAAQVLTNGRVALALAGKGEGFDLGIGVAGVTIERAK